MSEYRKLRTVAAIGLEEIRLYEHTLEHIRQEHPEVPILLPMLQSAVESAVMRPTHVEQSYGNSYVFVDATSTNHSGDPLRVPVKAVTGTSGRVRTAYFASTTSARNVVWRRDND